MDMTKAGELSLAELVKLRQSLDDIVAARVRGLRSAGMTWAEIAKILQVSQQAAHKRYRPDRDQVQALARQRREQRR